MRKRREKMSSSTDSIDVFPSCVSLPDASPSPPPPRPAISASRMRIICRG